ncbi:MAG: glycosyltransferase family 2 protein [Methylococcales bacterium]|nr:glycosyltransferase family 2 protein [Methylococcales bacterium]
MNDMPSDLLVYISVLNWNKADSTLVCLEHLLKSDTPKSIKITFFVVDNGSDDQDWQHLANGIKDDRVNLIRLEQNRGFSGGHNIVMQRAIDDNADYVWLVNNDGISLPDTLAKMVAAAETDATYGALSPLIVTIHDNQHIDFCGAYHNWEKLSGIRYDSPKDCLANGVDEKRLWLQGAAILFRVAALKQVGLLDDKFFAYYEDNDICAKLAFSGWKNKVVVDALFQHDIPGERQPYFYYLMARNAFFFWRRHTPEEYRRFISLRLLERALFSANKLVFDTESKSKVDACLLGGLDGLLGRGGQPNLSRKAPWIMVLLRKLLWPYHSAHIKKCY